MSKFSSLFYFTLLEGYDRDDPTDNFWQAARDYKAQQFQDRIEKEKIYSKPIEPLKKEDLVFIKAITKPLYGAQRANEMYLTNQEKFPYTYNPEKAWKFPMSKAQKFVDDHPKVIKDDPVLKGDQYKYELHFEIEQI